ncbi:MULTISPECIES: cupredoxin domain-containing protein [Halomonadaceae]|uniref:EfeO-type cupredoxin-like domain-containing protein n=1 Tax=Vreelandella halophila TaxID=86177 RepID=A0A9X5B3T0_9GAMM|nr:MULTISPECIES: cupredoxin domain-containing protein [Halomonas]MYL25825.1 hypothetical protein [Halomonas utahensis]MYL76113.1 hypothetical protein [Halomonas sp. 22501_18_FS]
MRVRTFGKQLSALLLGFPVIALAAESADVTIQAKPGFQFEPSTIEVPAGAEVTVNFENTGAMGHNFTVPELNAGTETIGADQNESITFTVGESGSYEFICDVAGHAAAGMTGTLKVK